MFAGRVIFQISQVLLKSSVCIGVTVSHVNGVVIILEAKSKGETAVITPKLSFHIVSIVTNLTALSYPTYSFDEGGFLRVDQGFHPHVVETIGFK